MATGENGVLLLTGTCGSGKTTVSTLLGKLPGWERVGEDEIWQRFHGRERGPFGSEEHRRKRTAVHEVVHAALLEALAAGRNAVLDATVHESPPEAWLEYRDFFDREGIRWTLRVLHPRLEVAIHRAATREGWHAPADRVASLRAKFSGAVFPPEWFLDTSEQTPELTAELLKEQSLGWIPRGL